MSKGQSEFISMFFLVIVILAVVFAFILFEQGVLVIDFGLDSGAGDVEHVMHLKNAFFRCYGYPLLRNMSVGCSPIEKSETLLGWSLVQTDFGYCSHVVLHNETPDQYRNIVTYILPIRNNETICPAELRMYI